MAAHMLEWVMLNRPWILRTSPTWLRHPGASDDVRTLISSTHLQKAQQVKAFAA